MTKLKLVAVLAVLLAAQPAFARGGSGGGMGHGDHTTMTHNDHLIMTHSDHPTMMHGQGTGRHAPNAHRAAEIQRLEAQIRAVQAKIFKLFNAGMLNAALLKRENQRINVLAARLHRLGGQLIPAGAGA